MSLAAVGAIALAAATLACGGDSSDGSGPISEAEARETANEFLLVSLGLFTGDSEPQAFIDLFAPECREEVDESAVAFAMLFIQAFAPELSEIDIEEVDVGEVAIEQTDEGTLVTPVDLDALSVKVDGEVMTVDELFESLGFDESEDDLAEPLLLVRRDGGIYLGDCSELSNFSAEGDNEGFGAQGTVVIQPGDSTPAPSAAGPGSSREEPVPLGVSAVVDDTWEVTVVQVVPDAWPLLQAEFSANEPPGPEERMLMVTVLVENVSSESQPQYIGGFELGLTGSRNVLYSQFDEQTYCGAVPDDLDADLFPGGQTEGNVCFKIPAAESDLVLVWEAFFGELTYFAIE